MSTQIHQATIRDLHLLVDVFDQYRIFYGEPSDKQSAETFLFDKFEHNESVIFIARDEKFTYSAGFTQLYSIFSSVSLKRKWLLNDLFVVKAFRKQGVAERLMNAAKDFAIRTKSKGLELSTSSDNVPAQKLYGVWGT